MAIDKLAIYNDALRLAGSERLAAVDEAREVRYKLDEIWDLDAPGHCLRLAKPVFARKTRALTSTATTTNHALENEFDLPTDFKAIYEVYADADLDQIVRRRIVEGSKLYTEITTVYLRYIADFTTDLTAWSPDFVRVVSAYLAQQITTRVSPEKYEARTKDLEAALEASFALSGMDEPDARPARTLTTLKREWLPVYNDALQILGRPKLTTINDERIERVQFDVTRDARLVEDMLADYPWNFSRVSVKIDRNTRLEPDWGYQEAFEKPVDMLRLDGVFVDEGMRVPLKNYADEGSIIYCNQSTIYLRYVPRKYLEAPEVWPSHFARYVGAALACSAAGSIPGITPQIIEYAMMQKRERKDTAENRDFMQSPPVRIGSGSWVAARSRGGRNEYR